MKVLFVEDDVYVAQAARRFFRDQPGWDIDVAHDGSEAVRMFAGASYGVVLIDWTLPRPGPDGLEVCRRIRRLSQSVLLIFVTARNSTDDIVLALGAGADEFVVKPFDPVALLARIAALVRRSSLPPTPEHLGAPTPGGSSPAAALEPKRRHEQIIDCLSRGLANKEIALALGCSVKNVEYHVGRILRKTGCSSRAELLVKLQRDGLVHI